MDCSFTLTQEEFRPSLSIFSQLKIEFDFFFKSEYYILNQDSTTPHFLECFHSSYDRTSAGVIVGESLSYDDIREAVGEAVGDHLLGGKREELIELACAEVRKRFPTETLPDQYELVILSFDVRILHRHVPVVESDMLPAAESSFELLEKYEVDRIRAGGEEEERRCCICLEELAGAGGGAVRMPCWHVFHGGCVKEWLRRSHCCPLCRYEMPTEQSCRAGEYVRQLK